MTKHNTRKELQGNLFNPLLCVIVSPRHAMVKLAEAIDRQSFENSSSANFCAENGHPSCPVFLTVALHDLKCGEAVLDEWLGNSFVNRFRKRVSRSLCRWWNQRSVIEPVIGHCKRGHRMDRNQLRGSLGDEQNVIFAAAGFNIRKLMRAFALFWCRFFKLALIQLV